MVEGRKYVSKYTVLYIEDEPWNIVLMEGIFRKLDDYTLLVETDAEKGIQTAIHEQPDVILMDLNLPGMNGYEALKILQADSTLSGVPVLAITAHAAPEDLARTEAAGFFSTVVKPFTIAELTKAVIQAAEKYSS